MARVYISALHKSSGKTVLSVGLCAALRARGRTVQTFKKGPDYIDPMWLTAASGRSCFNLDFHTMSDAQIVAAVTQRKYGAELALIEGNKGLHDGVAVDGVDSNASLARLLLAPVVLVVDAAGMTRSIAPMLQGFVNFDSEVNVAGVIFNKVGGERHEGKLRAAVEQYCDLPVLGAVPRTAELGPDERYIGLVPVAECAEHQRRVDTLANIARERIDLDAFESIAASAPKLNALASPSPPEPNPPVTLTIAVARGAAFCFYYPDDLEALERAGARLAFFDPVRDGRLPAADALFIGGGFPELHMEALAANGDLRAEIRTRIADGLPVYAECGGLMYLARQLSWGDKCCPMVGAINGDVTMHERPQGRGYVVLEESDDHPWPAAVVHARAGAAREGIPAHEFHHSTISGLEPCTRYAYRVKRGNGIDGKHDGIVFGNGLASYAHRRDAGNHGWVQGFLGHVGNCRDRRSGTTLSRRA